MTARVALASRRAAEQKVWQASQLEFEDVIAAPETRDHLERCVRTLLPPAPGTSAKCAP